MKRSSTPYLWAATILVLLLLLMSWPSRANAQQAQTPVTGHYPGGHVGTRGGDSPDVGGAYVNFSRIHVAGDLKDASGNTIKHINDTAYANINVFTYTTDIKFFGMNYGVLMGVPFNDIYNRPSGQSESATGFGLGDIVIIPFGLYGKAKEFDYQVGAGVWAPSGSFSPGSASNHGAGFWEAIYSIGGAYYPGGDRRSWCLSAVARFEQNFKQRGTNINVGDDVVIDYGIDKLFIFGGAFKQVLSVGVSGFATTQLTRESGANAAANTSLYHVFGLGPEVKYALPSYGVKVTFRPQWEFAASNTSQGATYWLAIGYAIP